MEKYSGFTEAYRLVQALKRESFHISSSKGMRNEETEISRRSVIADLAMSAAQFSQTAEFGFMDNPEMEMCRDFSEAFTLVKGVKMKIKWCQGYKLPYAPCERKVVMKVSSQSVSKLLDKIITKLGNIQESYIPECIKTEMWSDLNEALRLAMTIDIKLESSDSISSTSSRRSEDQELSASSKKKARGVKAFFRRTWKTVKRAFVCCFWPN